VPDSPSNCPSVHRQLLTGGVHNLKLSLTSVSILIGCAAIVLFIELATTHVNGNDWATTVSSVGMCILTAFMIAAMATRWLGDRLGTLAGLLHMTGLHAVLADLPPSYTILGAVTTIAMAFFALANVQGRFPLASSKWTGWTFYLAIGVSFLLGGPEGAASVVSGCVLFILVNQDTKTLGFFVNGWGLATLALLIVAWWVAGQPAFPATWNGNWTSIICRSGQLSDVASPTLVTLCEMPILFLPWTPFAIVALSVGVAGGHYATPYWRFLGCWIVGVYAAGLLTDRPLTTAILPPMAVIGAGGLLQYLRWSRLHSYKIPQPNGRVTS